MDRSVKLSDIRMHYLDSGGDGPLLILLHGWPQTSRCWQSVIPMLAEEYRVVAPDMRGYGLTDKPTHGYDKKTMARDIAELMEHLGYDTARIVGHDRGARVGHRFAIEYPHLLTHLTVLDIVPTLHTFRNGTTESARRFWHWLFHMQADLPELLVGPRIPEYLNFFFERWTVQRHALEDAIPEYIEAYSRPGALRAGFADYRATPEDLEHDAADLDSGNTVDIPVQVLWGDGGLPAGMDVVDAWTPFAPRAFGQAVADCGHFIAEEQPRALVDLLKPYLASTTGSASAPYPEG